MGRHLHNIGTISILNGQTDSAIFGPPLSGTAPTGSQAVLGSIANMIIYTPATLPETITLLVSPLDSTGGPPAAPNDLKTLQWQPGQVLTLTAGVAMNIPLVAGFRSFRIHAAAAVAAQRDFVVVVQLDVDATE